MPALVDKVVIVTGAGRGIGRAIAMAAAGEGAKVVVADYGVSLHGDTPDPALAHSVAAEIPRTAARRSASRAMYRAGEMPQRSSMRRWTSGTGLTVSSAARGSSGTARSSNLTDTDFDAVIATHLKGHFLMFQAAMAAIVSNGTSGSLVGISSGYGQGDSARAPYRAAKAGVIALTKSVALAGKEHGIRANVISPIASTRMTQASKLQN